MVDGQPRPRGGTRSRRRFFEGRHRELAIDQLLSPRPSPTRLARVSAIAAGQGAGRTTQANPGMSRMNERRLPLTMRTVPVVACTVPSGVGGATATIEGPTHHGRWHARAAGGGSLHPGDRSTSVAGSLASRVARVLARVAEHRGAASLDTDPWETLMDHHRTATTMLDARPSTAPPPLNVERCDRLWSDVGRYPLNGRAAGRAGPDHDGGLGRSDGVRAAAGGPRPDRGAVGGRQPAAGRRRGAGGGVGLGTGLGGAEPTVAT